MESNNLRGTVAVAGVGESDLGKLPESDGVGLRMQAASRALADAGLTGHEVDGLFTTGGNGFQATDLAEKLRINPSYVDSTLLGGASFVSYLTRAACAISTGQCDVALAVYGESSWANQRKKAGLYGGQHALVPERVEFEDIYGNFLISSYAMAAKRHMHEYGTTSEQLASVAVAARKYAAQNEKALLRDPITVADVMESRLVAEPFHLLDCCPVTDGGGAFVVVRAARAKDLPNAPVYFLGGGDAMTHNIVSQMPSLTETGAVQSGRLAMEMAQVRPEDIKVAEIYDAFTYLPVVFLEDLGFCKKGEGGAFVEGGETLLGGTLPMNTHGGALSYTQPGMHGAFLVIEAVRQLRGESGVRQVGGADIALVHANGGVMSHQSTAILGTTF